MNLEDLPPSCGDMIVLACFQCRKDMVRNKADGNIARKYGLLVFGGMAGGKAYCCGCFHVPKPTSSSPATADDDNPWQQNAIRELEDME